MGSYSQNPYRFFILFLVSVLWSGCLQTGPSTATSTPRAATPNPAPDLSALGDLGPDGSVTCNGPQSAFQCMMCNCHHETEGESYAGKVAVGKVVMTRVGMDSYPNSVCGVVYQPSQFSWTLSSTKRRERISGESYRNCYRAVQASLAFRGHYASHFHTPSVSPRWARTCRRLERIDGHIFYESCPGQDRAPASPQTTPSGGGGTEVISWLWSEL